MEGSMHRHLALRTFVLLSLAAGAAASAAGVPPPDQFADACAGQARPPAPSKAPYLANGPRQSCIEQRALTLYRSAPVQQAIGRLEAALRADPRVAAAGQQDRAPIAAQQIGFGEIERLINNDAADPFPFWFYKPGHRLGAATVPGGKFAASNPDTVFRFIPFDPAGRYELRGQFLSETRPSYFSLHIKGARAADGQEKDADNLFDKDIRADTAGNFTIRFDSDLSDGMPNHVTLPVETTGVIIRDTLEDWAKELPTRLTVVRTDVPRNNGATRAAAGDAALIETAARNIDHAAQSVPAFRDTLFFKGAANALPQPGAHVSGSWARAVSANFALMPGEALVFTLDPGGARYLGVQTGDLLTGAIEPESRTSALNDRQAQHNADGTITYVLAPADPGTGNWIDTGGVTQGIIMIRWQGLTDGARKGPAVVDARTMPAAQARALAATAGLKPVHISRAERHALYMRRYSGW
jgi:hypothetical protein